MFVCLFPTMWEAHSRASHLSAQQGCYGNDRGPTKVMMMLRFVARWPWKSSLVCRWDTPEALFKKGWSYGSEPPPPISATLCDKNLSRSSFQPFYISELVESLNGPSRVRGMVFNLTNCKPKPIPNTWQVSVEWTGEPSIHQSTHRFGWRAAGGSITCTPMLPFEWTRDSSIHPAIHLNGGQQVAASLYFESNNFNIYLACGQILNLAHDRLLINGQEQWIRVSCSLVFIQPSIHLDVGLHYLYPNHNCNGCQESGVKKLLQWGKPSVSDASSNIQSFTHESCRSPKRWCWHSAFNQTLMEWHGSQVETLSRKLVPLTDQVK